MISKLTNFLKIDLEKAEIFNNELGLKLISKVVMIPDEKWF